MIGILEKINDILAPHKNKNVEVVPDISNVFALMKSLENSDGEVDWEEFNEILGGEVRGRIHDFQRELERRGPMEVNLNDDSSVGDLLRTIISADDE